MSLMNELDSVSGSCAECFITIGSTRYNFMQIINFESTVEKKKAKIPILGKTGEGSKSCGWSGKFKGTAHYNQSIMRDMLYQYASKGIDTYFEIQVTNEDPTSSIGRQTVIHKGCNLDGGTLAKFDAESEYLDEEIAGTFSDFEIPERFKILKGMK